MADYFLNLVKLGRKDQLSLSELTLAKDGHLKGNSSQDSKVNLVVPLKSLGLGGAINYVN